MKQPIIALLLLSFCSTTIHAANDEEYRPMTPKKSNAMLVRRKLQTTTLPKQESIESSTGGESDSPLITLIPVKSDSDTEEPEIQPVDSDNDAKSPSPVVNQKPNFIGWMQQRAQEDEALEKSLQKKP